MSRNGKDEVYQEIIILEIIMYQIVVISKV